MIAPLPLKEIGLNDFNRVGIAPDAAGNPMICFAGSAKQLALLAGLPGVQRWVPYDCLAYPLNRTNLLVTETVGRVEEATADYAQARNALLAAPREQYAYLYPPTPPGEPEPMAHQVDAFCCACEAFDKGFHGFGQYSEQGCGKTRWCCDMLRQFGGKASVVIAQNSTLLQWHDWLKRICSGFDVHVLSGMSLKRRAALIDEVTIQGRFPERPVIFLVNWEVVHCLQDAFVRLQPDMVIADEASRIKERTALMSKALHRIGAAAKYRIAMTGTPMGNSPGDLWSIYKFLEPSLFPKSYWEYMKTYFLLGGFSGHDFVSFNPSRVGDFVLRLYSLAYRVTKASIGDLPEKTFEVVRLDMTAEQQRLYKQVEDDLYATRLQEDGTVAALTIANVLEQSVRLQQITAGQFPINSGDALTARSVPITSAKTIWLQSYCKENLRDTDAQIVVWARFTAEIDAIARALSEADMVRDQDYAIIDGRVKTADRRRFQVAFNDRENRLRILVCQIAAVALGWDIPTADVMIYHSGTFSYLERAQSLERGHRLGRTRPYTVIDLVCKNSIDTKILQAVKRKEKLADMLLVEGFV